ncbi:MAG TPA: RNA polymerase sigma factor [Phycisphaerales bacterium]|nr:RNA polymerase sigma factor [Phycisphaerales bacterium]
MRLDEPSDETLVSRYVKGDRTVLRTLIERHKSDLLRFLTRLTGDREAAEDAFQETFLQFHLSAKRFDTSRRFKPWIFTIAANKARDAMRKKGRRPALGLSAQVNRAGGSPVEFVDLMEIEVPSPDAGLESKEQQELVAKAMDELSYTLREVLLLAYFQRLSYAQIAEDLDIPLGTVKSRLHSAVATFAKRYAELSAQLEKDDQEDHHSEPERIGKGTDS